MSAVVIAILIGIYVNLLSGRYFRFQDIKADLAHQVFVLRQRYEITDLDGSSPRHLWKSTSVFIQSIFQPAYFRLELERQTAAKEEVGKLMNEIINECDEELKLLNNGGLRDLSNTSPVESLRSSIISRFEREKDRHVNRIRSIKPSIRALVFLESIRIRD